MADNNLARNRNDGADFFADDDPLAELARIVGYDERLVPKPPVAGRREPAFNLEDELLQEFERYEAPRPHQPSVSVSDAATPVGSSETPDHDDAGASFDVAPEVPSHAGGEPAYSAEPSFAVEPAFDPEPDFAIEPVFDAPSSFEPAASLEPAMAEVTFESVEPETQNGDEPVEPQVVADDADWAMSPSEAIVTQDDVADTAVELAPQAVAEPTFDLSDEVELSIGAAEVLAAPAPEASVRAGRKPIYTPGFRMPLANFNSQTQPARVAAAPSDMVSRVEPVLDAPTEVQHDISLTEVVPTRETSSHEVAAAEVQSLAAPVEQVSFEPSDMPQIPDDAFSLDDDALTLSDEDLQPSGPTISEPRWDVPFDFRDDGVSERVQTPMARSAETDAQNGFIDPLLDDDFELALDDLELDLTEMFSDEDLQVSDVPTPVAPAAPIAVAAAAPATMPSPVEPPRFTASWSPVARVVPTPSVAAPVPAPAPTPTPAAYASMPVQPVAISRPPEPVVEPVAAGYVVDPAPSLAFDPTLISETEEQPEPVFDLNVPELQVEEQEPAPVYRNDYDYDIDAELASLLEPIAAEAAEANETDEVSSAEQPQAPAVPSSYLDLDDFERALEQDFRRSLTAPLPIQPGMDDLAARSGRPASEGSRRSISAFAVPLAMAGVVIAGGSIAYALFGGDGSSMASNGEPIVIAADTSPVKVLPANPGGKTVPNQDKAVYDRVAGAVPAAPTQEALISSSEEPVDVVQKTLMSDQLPLEGESNAEFADSTTDSPYREDRLTPDMQQAELPAEPSQSVAVMPRRVKTMIVRPDGTLVEQEVDAPAEPVATAAASLETQKIAASSVRNVETASIPDASIGNVNSSVQGQTAGIVPVSADASVDLTAAPETAGLPLEAPVADQPSVAAPVPMARPARQAANVAASPPAQDTVAAAPAAQAAPAPAPAATQVASLSPGDYVIQIASLPSAADAEKSYANLSSKFSSVIGGRGVDIRAAEIAGKGTFYRVRIPAGSKAEAVQLCESYRAAGGSCLVAR